MHPAPSERSLSSRTLRTTIAAAAAFALAISGLVVLAAPANAAPKGTLTAKRVNLANDEVVPVALTNYPAGEITVSECAVSKDNMMTVGECAPAPVVVTVPDTAGGRGDAAPNLTVKQTFGSTDCKVQWCAYVTTHADPAITDAAVKKTITFSPAPTLTVDAPGGIPATNTVVNVTGANFRNGVTVYLLQCAATSGSCDNTTAIQPTAAANGSFTAAFTVKPSITIGGNPYDCTAVGNTCTLQTSNTSAGADTTQQALTPIQVGRLRVSKASGLAYNGENVTVSGVKYVAGTSFFITVCNVNAPIGSQCNMNLIDVGNPTADGSGAFSITMKPKASFTAGNATVNCTAAGVKCALQAVNAGAPTDHSQDSTVFIDFAAKPATPPANVAKAPTKAKITKIKVKGKTKRYVVVSWTKAKAQGTPITGYVVQIKAKGKAWKTAKTVSSTKATAKYTKVKVGKKYTFRIKAKSAAGASTSATKAVKIKK